MSPQRVIRPAARRSPAGAGSLLWTAAAAALPVIVTVLVLVVLTLGVLVFSASGFDSLVPVVAVEWLVVNRVPLTVDAVELGFLPLLPPLLYVAVLARQTRAVLADVEQPGAPEAGAAVVGATVTGVLLTALASLLMGSAASDFAVRESSLPVALLWSAAVGFAGSACGVWLFFRRSLRERLPVWVRGGLHLGVAFVAATWAVGAVLVLIGVLFAWETIAASLEIGKGFVGTAALTGISVAYLPNVVMAAAALTVGGEAHLGEASYSVFAVSRGPMPEVPLAAALPTTSPHWVVQGLLLVTVLVVAGLARYVAPWFRTTADAVKATWLAAAIVALMMAVIPVVAGGQLGVLGQVGTGWMIASVMALLLFGIIGSATVALSLAGLTRRRERAEDALARRRRRAGVDSEDPVSEDALSGSAGSGSTVSGSTGSGSGGSGSGGSGIAVSGNRVPGDVTSGDVRGAEEGPEGGPDEDVLAAAAPGLEAPDDEPPSTDPAMTGPWDAVPSGTEGPKPDRSDAEPSPEELATAEAGVNSTASEEVPLGEEGPATDVPSIDEPAPDEPALDEPATAAPATAAAVTGGPGDGPASGSDRGLNGENGPDNRVESGLDSGLDNESVEGSGSGADDASTGLSDKGHGAAD